MAPPDLLTATAHQLERALAEGKASSTQLVTAYLGRIAKYNPFLNAIISTAPTSSLLSIARHLDQERADGHVRGPLHGIPILLKDNIATRHALGMETTAGTFALVGSVVKQNAPLVTQVGAFRQSAASRGSWPHHTWQSQPQCESSAASRDFPDPIHISNSLLTHVSGFWMPCGWSAVGGLTQSPYVVGGKQWDDGFGGHSSCGGSSSGSCVAVAAGLAPLSIGTETNGSLLMPATRNDVYTIKPTLGLIDASGIVPICREFDSAGPIAHCATDIAYLMDILVNPELSAHVPPGGYQSQLTGSLEGLRIGVLDPREWHLPTVESDILEAYGKLTIAVAEVRRVQLPSLDGLEVDGMSHIARVMNSGFKTDVEGYLAGPQSSTVRTLDDLMQFMTDHADQEFPPEAIDECLQKHNVDVILGPADSELDDYYCVAGYPMAHLPLSSSKHSLRPFGMCAMASECQEGLLVRVTSGWEKTVQTSRQLPKPGVPARQELA
ncbi:putative glutamyl-tRNA amidotransferase subunit A [Microdochium trichocladiopsis]|uniref:Glutamyl-tRNA amidotransferase subunit A n=1 Tax=Microdochium trichocladiopsis TaxID=1682393 RepID=A0A9P8Y7T7_9PEZI|nr:putative glutamyl-tRNA amidotransferase subunit A [Microdochium trichocladiopsis]KAH7031512.1 putative glutamyl-tRNA amidotransferase subunit A [Microdochium trichocladiopsis]